MHTTFVLAFCASTNMGLSKKVKEGKSAKDFFFFPMGMGQTKSRAKGGSN